MKSTRIGFTAVAVLWGVTAMAADRPDKSLPPDIKAILEEHVGSWEATGWTIDEKGKKPMKATWTCRHLSDGPAVLCTWHHAWVDKPPDVEEEIIGFDRESGKLRFTRAHPDGSVGTLLVDATAKTMDRHWEFEKDGNKGVGNLHIEVREPGHWEQTVTVEVGGKRTFEMVATQRRLAK
jgi:hypothetical protein